MQVLTEKQKKARADAQRKRLSIPENAKKHAERSKQYRLLHPDRRRNVILKNKYGITLEQFNEILMTQNGVCACCKKPETKINNQTKKVQPLSVDHCHETGKVRGLLCDVCNTTLGKIKENISTLGSMIDYLLKNKGGV